MSKLSMQQAVQINRHIRKHPEWFFEHMLGVKMQGKQIDIVRSVMVNRVTTVRSCHAAGKSFTAACTAIWFLMAYPESIVVTTAPTWRQVKDILWREIATRFAKAKIDMIGREPSATGLNIGTNWFAVGLSTKDPDRFQGYHADSGHLLVITDEAAGMEEAIFEAIDAVLTSADCRLLMIGNPTSASGTFRDSHKPSYPANKIKINAFDTPNFVANGLKNEQDLLQAVRDKRPLKTVANYLCDPIWVYEKIRKWGINSPMYQGRVAAEFPDMAENTLVPLSWLEAACTNERLEKIVGLRLPDPTPGMSIADMEKLESDNKLRRTQALNEYLAAQNRILGVDVARFGSDSTVLQPRYGSMVPFADTYFKEDTMQTAGRVWSRLQNLPTEHVGVDVIGLGAGVVDRLWELQKEQNALNNQQWSKIVGVNVALPATAMPKALGQMEFANRRAELYWELRERFERGDIYLMPDEDGNPPEDLMDQLSSLQYKYVGNKIYIEEKAEFKKRFNGNKSPDQADALMLTFDAVEVSSWDGDMPSTKNEQDIFVRRRNGPVIAGRPVNAAEEFDYDVDTIMGGIDAERY